MEKKRKGCAKKKLTVLGLEAFGNFASDVAIVAEGNKQRDYCYHSENDDHDKDDTCLLLILSESVHFRPTKPYPNPRNQRKKKMALEGY